MVWNPRLSLFYFEAIGIKLQVFPFHWGSEITQMPIKQKFKEAIAINKTCW